MDKATLTISLPRPMKDFIVQKVQGGRFSTPSEYIRSLIREDQDEAQHAKIKAPKSGVQSRTKASGTLRAARREKA